MSGVVDFNNFSIEVYDMLGKKVSSISQITTSNKLNIEGYNKGLYFISIMRNGVLIKTSKLIKE